jgi:AraC-like DNA-binding protein
MEVLQLKIPPLPQFLTAGYSVWKSGMQHFERSFEVYDMLIVCSGTLYMTENGVPYEIRSGELLLLEPGRPHYGHLACTGDTAIYWVHFKHDPPAARLDAKQIPWSAHIRRGTDSDLVPAEQVLFLPKYGTIDLKPLIPTLDDILRLREGLTVGYAVDLQVVLGRLLSQLQSGLRAQRRPTRSFIVAEQAKAYLQEHFAEPFRAELLEGALHFDFDYAARCLKRHTGMSPLQYHHTLSIEEAKRMLANTTLPVQEVAVQVGFNDYNYFIRLFRKTVGMTPGVYRRSFQGYV